MRMRPVAGSQFGSVVAAACEVAAGPAPLAVVFPAAPVLVAARVPAAAPAPPVGTPAAPPAVDPPGGATVTSTLLFVVGCCSPCTGVDWGVPNWPALVWTLL